MSRVVSGLSPKVPKISQDTLKRCPNLKVSDGNDQHGWFGAPDAHWEACVTSRDELNEGLIR